MKKIAFVPPWYGDSIPGGAETELRETIRHLDQKGISIEVLTTCVKEFASDWNDNYHSPGKTRSGNIIIRRFPVRRRNTASFDRVNAKLMKGLSVTPRGERIFIREMINSPDLYRYIYEHRQEYDLFLYIPYMFGTTYYGILKCPEKSVMFPCFHEEPYIHMGIYRKAFEKVAGLIYYSEPEYELANSVFDFQNARQEVLGAGVDTEITYDAERFRKKYGIEEPFLLYAGRKDEGKNIGLLLDYFSEYRFRNKEEKIKLVLIGGGKVKIPAFAREDVVDLGFIDRQDKYDACAAAVLLCQPSLHESFSIVIMESWLTSTPVLVHEGCDVTRSHVSKSNGGLYFKNYNEFEACVKYIVSNPDVAGVMGENGKKYVEDNYSWQVLTDRYIQFMEEITHDQSQRG